MDELPRLDNHYPIYKGPLSICGYCGMMFISEEFLTKHQKKCMHMKILSICKVKLQIRRETINPNIAGSIINVQNKGINDDYFCEKCFCGFLKLSDYNRHIRHHHSSDKEPFQPEKGERKRQRKQKLNEKCDICSKMFLNKYRLSRHYRRHTGEKPFQCNQCSSCFSQKHNLMVHLRTHSGEKPFMCTYCPMRFGQKVILKNHLRTHTGEKPFACPECSMKFTHGSTLKRHLMSHSGERPYGCEHCKAHFSRRNTLIKHLRTHGKVFSCTYCKLQFKEKTLFTSHLKTHF